MDINSLGIKNYFREGYQRIAEQAGKLLHHTLSHLQQDHRLALMTVVGVNILFAEVAFRIVVLSDPLFAKIRKCLGNYGKLLHDLTVINAISFSCYGMNFALIRRLPNLNPFVTGMIAAATVCSYFPIRVNLQDD